MVISAVAAAQARNAAENAAKWVVSKSSNPAVIAAARTVAWNTSPKITAPTSISTTNSANKVTPKYTPPKVQYGDNASLPAVTNQTVATQNTAPWVKLTTWEIRTKGFDTSFEWPMIFWEEAKAYESKNLWYLDKRNDYLAQEFLSKNPTVTQDQLNDQVTKYLQGKWIKGTPEDIANTVSAFGKRIQWLPAAATPVPGISSLDVQYQSQRDQLLKAGAIEDRYTNFNDVDSEVNNVLKAWWEDRVAKWYDGMPSDKDIQDIANKTWVNFDRAKRIMEWFGYETLDMQWEYKKEFEKDYNRNIDDLTLEKQRQTDDLNTKMAETKQSIQRQQQDILRQAEENTLAMEKIWALKWYANTTSFVDGVNSVHEEALRTVSRLETQLQQAQNATDENKSRLLEDYNTNLSRAKEDLDLQARDIKQQMGTAYNTILQNYSGTQLKDKLETLNRTTMDAKLKVMNDYIATVTTLNRTKNDEIDQMIQNDNYISWSQTEVFNKLTADGWDILQNHSIADLAELYKQWHISLDQYQQLHTSMLEKAKTTLDASGTPITADYQKLSKLMIGWATPAAAIQDVILQWWTRYKDAKASLLTPNSAADIDTWVQSILDMPEWATYERGWDCGIIVNDYVKSVWAAKTNLFGDSLASKTKNINSHTPEVGDVAIMTSKSKPGNGHVAIVTSVSPDGKTMSIRWSNFHKDWKISEDTVSTNVLWFYNPTKEIPKIGETNTTTTTTENNWNSTEKTDYLKKIVNREVWVSDINSAASKELLGTKWLSTVEAKMKVIGDVLDSEWKNAWSYYALYNLYGDNADTRDLMARTLAKKSLTEATKYIISESEDAEAMIKTIWTMLQWKTPNVPYFKKELAAAWYVKSDINTIIDEITNIYWVKKPK